MSAVQMNEVVGCGQFKIQRSEYKTAGMLIFMVIRCGERGRRELGERMKIVWGSSLGLAGCLAWEKQQGAYGVTLAEIPNSCGIWLLKWPLPVARQDSQEGCGQQPTQKAFDQKCVLPIRCAGTKMEQRLWK